MDIEGKKVNKINVYFPSLENWAVSILSQVRKSSLFRDRVKFWFFSETFKTAPASVRQIRDRAIIDENVEVDGQNQYYEWTGIQSDPLQGKMKAMVWRRRRDGTEFVVCGGEEKRKDLLIAFVDAQREQNLPDEFIKFRWVRDFGALESYCNERIEFDRIVENPEKFKKTSWIARNGHANTPVYRGVSGAYKDLYFYRDQLHIGEAMHYEVFDLQKRHVGEMSKEGKIDRTKADNTKHWPVAT